MTSLAGALYFCSASLPFRQVFGERSLPGGSRRTFAYPEGDGRSKAQEAFRDAGELARRLGNPVTNDAHVFLTLLQQEEGVVRPLLQKLGLNVTELIRDTQREISRFPTQQGGAEPTFSREVQRIFDHLPE